MLKFGNKEFRNLQEQVYKNMKDILFILQEEGVLNEFGIKVVGQEEAIADMPTVEDYKEDNPEWSYGDAYAIGTEEPYELYILTRANGTHANDYWFNIGAFPAPGPKGDTGAQGPIGPQGPTGNTGANGLSAGFGTITATAQTLVPGSSATATVTASGPDTAKSFSFTFGIPKGEKGKDSAGEWGDIGGTLSNQTDLQQALDNKQDTLVSGTNIKTINSQSILGSGDITAVGPQGPQGPVGPQGPKGDTGDTGPQGPKGDKGDTGAQGPIGPQGPKGATGDTGPKGDTGPQGATGVGISSIAKTATEGLVDTYTITYTNSTTSTFDVTNGAQGAQGPQGPQGIQGIQGAQGPKGDKGDTGPEGPQGIQGPAGADGLTTSISVNGATYTQVDGLITLPDYPSAPTYTAGDWIGISNNVISVSNPYISLLDSNNIPRLMMSNTTEEGQPSFRNKYVNISPENGFGVNDRSSITGNQYTYYKHDEIVHNGSYTLTLPNKTGTLAVTSDIPTVPTNYVTTDSAQTITGVKTYSARNKFQDGLSLQKNGYTVGHLYGSMESSTHRSVSLEANVEGSYAKIQISANTTSGSATIGLYGDVIPYLKNTDLGSNTYKFRDLYLSGNLNDGTNSVTVANIATKAEIPSVLVTDVTLGGTSVLSSGVAVLPAYPTVPTTVSSFTNDAGYITSSALSDYVPTTRTINGNALSSNISLTAGDVGAISSVTPTSETWTFTLDDDSTVTKTIVTAVTSA